MDKHFYVQEYSNGRVCIVDKLDCIFSSDKITPEDLVWLINNHLSDYKATYVNLDDNKSK